MSGQQRPNTLGMQERELQSLVGKLDSASSAGKAGRVFSRWRYPEKSVVVRITQPGGTDSVTRMACRNLSQRGIGLLHRSYVHIGTPCVVTLTHPAKGEQEYTGSVIRCLHVSGMVHEIGIKFDADIPIRQITRPDPMREAFTIENVDPGSLVGTLLVVEDSEMDVRLIKHFLRDTQLRVKHCESIDDAVREARSGVGLVLCDIHLGEAYGGDLVDRLSEGTGFAPPIVMISADRSERTHTLVSKTAVAGFLAKPIDQTALLQAIAEFMVDPGEARGAAEPSGIRADASIADALLPELSKACTKLRAAVDADDPTLAFSLLMQISGVAPVVGLDELAGLSESVGQQLAGNMELEKVRRRLDDIERLCADAIGS